MKKYISPVALFVVAILFLPTNTFAYKTTDQTAKRLTPTTAMYSITYVFGSPSRDLYLPIRTIRDGNDNSEVLSLGYEILEDKKTHTNAGETAALVFSNAKIVNNTYFIPAGSAAKFTLVGFLRTSVTTPEADYALKVNGLPFTEYNRFGDRIDSALNESELSYYITDEIELNN